VTVVLVFALLFEEPPIPVVLQLPVVPTFVPDIEIATTAVAFA
jgi:hypothetical protein